MKAPTFYFLSGPGAVTGGPASVVAVYHHPAPWAAPPPVTRAELAAHDARATYWFDLTDGERLALATVLAQHLLGRPPQTAVDVEVLAHLLRRLATLPPQRIG